MSRLREASTTLARTGAHPLLSTERLFATERVAAGLEARRIGEPESWSELAERAAEKGIASLSAADSRRLLANLWTNPPQARFAEAVIAHALGFARRSADRALIEAYLLDYPIDHAAFDALRAAAAVAADRHDWRWRETGRAWQVWEGAEGLRDALRLASNPAALLREAGFVGRLAEGAFVSAARADAVRSRR